MKAIFFDLYGTLLERSKDLQVYERLFQNLLDPKAAKRIALTQNHSLDSLASLLKVEMDISLLKQDLKEELASVRPYPETHDVLFTLKTKGMKLGLISNLSTPYKEPFFREKLESYFDALIFSCDKGYKKPQAEIYALACGQLGVSPLEAMMVGDSIISDYNGPLNADLRACLLDRSKKRADAIYTLEELLPRITQNK